MKLSVALLYGSREGVESQGLRAPRSHPEDEVGARESAWPVICSLWVNEVTSQQEGLQKVHGKGEFADNTHFP